MSESHAKGAQRKEKSHRTVHQLDINESNPCGTAPPQSVRQYPPVHIGTARRGTGAVGGEVGSLRDVARIPALRGPAVPERRRAP